MRANNDLNDVMVAGVIKNWAVEGEGKDLKILLMMTVTESVSGGSPRVYDVPGVLVGKVADVYLGRLEELSREVQALNFVGQGYLSPNYVKKEGSEERAEYLVVVFTHVIYLGHAMADQLTRVAVSGEVSFHTDDKPTAKGKAKQFMILKLHRKGRTTSTRVGVPVVLFESNANLDQPISRGSWVGFTGRLDSYKERDGDQLKLQIIALNNLVSNSAKVVHDLDHAVGQTFARTAANNVQAPPTAPSLPSAPPSSTSAATLREAAEWLGDVTLVEMPF